MAQIQRLLQRLLELIQQLQGLSDVVQGPELIKGSGGGNGGPPAPPGA